MGKKSSDKFLKYLTEMLNMSYIECQEQWRTYRTSF